MTDNQGTTGLTPNVAAMMCYILLPISSIIFLIVEKKDSDVRFHAWQGIFFSVGVFVVMFALLVLGVLLGALAGFLGRFVEFFVPIVGLAAFGVWLVCLIKAYQGERWKIPFIGDMAERQAS